MKMDKTFEYLIKILMIFGLLCILALLHLYFFPDTFTPDVIKIRIEVLKIVLASVVIGLLGIVIPNQLAQKKYDFELKKEERRQYSIISTGLKYLPYRIAVMDYENAIKHLENIHQAYHLLDVYDKSYHSQFKLYKIHKLRESFSKLMFRKDYQEGNVLLRIELIDNEWNKIPEEK